jgi:lipopolysaccharide transport system ATP-binding protein
MSELAIAVHQLGKSYRLYERPAHRLLEVLGRRPRHRVFRALDGVSFGVPRGEGLGIVGENGAGKSTLLKILAGITPPNEGRFEVAGKVAAILELGSGFHPEFSGRDNAVLNAALLGLSEPEVQQALPRILEFSELGEFIDQPVKTYSTGMAMRLAFAIATQVEPEVLIIDEALSVGDGYFQKKCLDRLLELIRQGRTVLFCSHAMYYVTSLCKHAVWLRNGRVERFGPALEVVEAYERYLLAKESPRQDGEGVRAASRVAGEEPARLVAATLGPAEPGAGGGSYHCGAPLELDLRWEARDSTSSFHLGVGIDRCDGVQVCSFATHQDGLPPFTGQRSYRVRLEIPELPILKGEFSVYVFLLDEAGLHVFDQRVLVGALHVESPDYRIGLVAVGHRWRDLAAAGATAPVPLTARAR